MKTKLFRVFMLACVTVIGSMSVSGQKPEGKMPPGEPQRLSAYQLTDEVRNAIGLDSKEFDKVYSAYEKYGKSVFGEDSSSATQPVSQEGRRGGGPGGMGGPGGGPGGPGGMGSPGGGMPPQGGAMGRPGGDFGGHRPPSTQPDDKQKTIDAEKFEKTKTKAEEKLCKAMKKIFKKNPEKYDNWLSLRNRQLENIFRPQPPHRDFKDINK